MSDFLRNETRRIQALLNTPAPGETPMTTLEAIQARNEALAAPPVRWDDPTRVQREKTTPPPANVKAANAPTPPAVAPHADDEDAFDYVCPACAILAGPTLNSYVVRAEPNCAVCGERMRLDGENKPVGGLAPTAVVDRLRTLRGEHAAAAAEYKKWISAYEATAARAQNIVGSDTAKPEPHVPAPLKIVVEECDRCWKPAACAVFGDEPTRVCLSCLERAVAALKAAR